MVKHKQRKKTFRFFLIIPLFFMIIGVRGVHAQGDGNPTAEAWVLDRIFAGEEANLSIQFPEEEDRRLSSAFLEELLSTSYGNSLLERKGVRIQNAIFPEKVDLSNFDIPFDLSIRNSKFEGGFILEDCIVRGDLSFSGSVFEPKRIFFDEESLPDSITSMSFVFPVSFHSAEIWGYFQADNTKYNGEALVTFESMKVGDTAFFNRAEFNGPVRFVLAEIGGQFVADDAQFKSEKKIEFDAMLVRDKVTLNRAVFAGPVSFKSVDIGGQFVALTTQFKSEERVTFANMIVGSDIFLIGAEFSGPVSFYFAEIGGMVYFDNTVWEAEGNQNDFFGFKYSQLNLSNDISGDFPEILDIIDKAIYYPSNYTELENMYMRLGYPDLADQTYVHQQQRERSERLSGLSWMWNLFLNILWVMAVTPREPFFGGR